MTDAGNNLGKLTKLEERRLATLLRYMRDNPKGILLATIDELTKQAKGGRK